ncbi:hypothetical protein LCGC14_0630300 [marine sediment metagenome]|uniref:Uncharacterized protein n=1 Tax=marine sediment metagenome TaxID=412755 RepID=A0A0F9TNK0_9ZZZZ
MDSLLSQVKELEKARILIDKFKIRLSRVVVDAEDAKVELNGLRASLTILKQWMEEK